MTEALNVFQEHESEVRSYVRSFPTVFDRARGSVMYDEDGKSYLDFFSGAGALNYGHNNPLLKDRLLEYMAGDGITHSLDMATKAKRKFIETFQEVILRPRGLAYKMLFPGPTGTNAVETALKLARKATGREVVWAFQGAFHGMTLGSLSITANRMKREGAGLPLNHSRLLPFEGESKDGTDSLSFITRELSLAAQKGELPAAIVLETIQCEGGVRVASADWMRSLAQLCREHGVLFVVDDIQAGCGRSGRFFSFEEAGLSPDIVCLSKSLSGLGMPFALVLLREELDVFRPGEHNGTFRGFNPSFITATAALEYWRDREFEQSVQKKAEVLRGRLEDIRDRHPELECELRGRGLVQGIRFEDPEIAGLVSQQCFERHLIVETAGHQDEVLKFLPALTIEERALEQGLDIVAESIDAVARERVAEPALA